MSYLPAIHLVIMQPHGNPNPLGFLDQARFFRHQFRRLGAQVTIGKNRLREDALNFVFGAWLGFPAAWRERHACVFVNLEQLGHGGNQVNAPYLELLRGSAVVDYDRSNVPAYADAPDSVPVISFGYAPYLDRAPACPAPIPLEERPIDLLFFGGMNERRKQFIGRVEAAGFNVAMFDHVLYGPERDHYIRQAKAVLNCHFYEINRFEQARAFHSLSLGTPVISERTPKTEPTAAFEDSVIWLPGDVEGWFRDNFATPRFYADARACLAAFRTPDAVHDPLAEYADLLACASDFHRKFMRARDPGPWRPRAINLGSGAGYKPNWLNVDTVEREQPDLVLDLGQALALPHEARTTMGGSVRLEEASVERIQADGVLARVADLPALMDNALRLLTTGGEFHIEVPYERARTAWADPTSLRALNENSWNCYTDTFWQLGWLEHRFEMTSAQWLDASYKACAKENASFMRLALRKVATTPRERLLARMMRADFGGLDPDDVCDEAVAASI
jgi:hypothetical protein